VNWVGDVSVEGLGKAMQGALDLHQGYPKNKQLFAAKRGPAPDFPVPEKFPSLGKFGPQLDYKGNVVQSCIHCHQVGDAMRDLYRKKKQPMPEELVFPYPHPKAVGLTLDPKQKAKVLEVAPGSAAEKSGFAEGDEIKTLDGQPILSIADVQWVLHRTSPDGGSIKAEVQRKDKTSTITLLLDKGWRQRDEISWRSSAWGYRRMVTGGLLLESIEDRPTGVPATGMALRVKHVGQYGPHAAAKNAGFQTGDIIVSFDGKASFGLLDRETDLMAYALRNRVVGDKVPVVVVRNGKQVTLSLPMQE
jgi:S1-C subfamily serine protease